MPYNASWMGLDSGEAEHLWNPIALRAIARLVSENEPVNFADPKATIYTDLASHFPIRSWVRASKSGVVRSALGKHSPLDRLGLIEGGAQGLFTVTPLGQSVIDGAVEPRELLRIACLNHEENGEYPFQIIASAFLEAQTHEFSIEDIEFGVMPYYRPGTDSIDAALRAGKSAARSWSNGARARRVKGMLGRLENIDAITSLPSGKWKSRSSQLLREISRDASTICLQYGHARQQPSAFALQSKDLNKFDPDPPAHKFGRVLTMEKKPLARAAALERAFAQHEGAVRAVAKLLADRNLPAYEDLLGLDIGTVGTFGSYLFEIKTWTSDSVHSEVPKAISQLFAYRWHYREKFGSAAKLAIVLDRPLPRDLDLGLSDFLSHLGIRLLEVSQPEGLVVDEHGDRFELA